MTLKKKFFLDSLETPSFKNKKARKNGICRAGKDSRSEKKNSNRRVKLKDLRKVLLTLPVYRLGVRLLALVTLIGGCLLVTYYILHNTLEIVCILCILLTEGAQLVLYLIWYLLQPILFFSVKGSFFTSLKIRDLFRILSIFFTQGIQISLWIFWPILRTVLFLWLSKAMFASMKIRGILALMERSVMETKFRYLLFPNRLFFPSNRVLVPVLEIEQLTQDSLKRYSIVDFICLYIPKIGVSRLIAASVCQVQVILIRLFENGIYVFMFRHILRDFRKMRAEMFCCKYGSLLSLCLIIRIYAAPVTFLRRSF